MRASRNDRRSSPRQMYVGARTDTQRRNQPREDIVGDGFHSARDYSDAVALTQRIDGSSGMGTTYGDRAAGSLERLDGPSGTAELPGTPRLEIPGESF
ncbi:hypothetical protein Aut01nite_39850 [Actinoplanes utahensis]|nr:hypothetical protein Aut01nite_39850 [Actinoplanes utahensis]